MALEDMYPSTVDKNDYNITIDGVQLIMEEVTANEAYNRRETARKNIIGGTQRVIRTNYIPRDYEFVTHVLIDPNYPDVYDDTFREWQSKSCEVVSRFMGGKFNAEVIVKRNFEDSPNYMKLEIQVIEIPTEETNIPNDEFTIPEDVISPVKVNVEKYSKNATNKKTNKKKSNKNNKSNKKKKSNITKTK